MRPERKPPVEHERPVPVEGAVEVNQKQYGHAGGSGVTEMPPRSRLYCLAPLEVGTSEVECLTSYITRLAWTYRVSPRVLVVQEIVPKLRKVKRSHSTVVKLGTYCRRTAMTINGAGEAARDWTETLEQLTMRGDLRNLTLQLWANGFPPRWLLRSSPAWCPICYQEWLEHERPLYQPLLWMLQVVIICFRHKRRLEEQCPLCQQDQSVIANTTQLGFCTQCAAWLGGQSDVGEAESIDDETLAWQEWVLECIEELQHIGMFAGFLLWKRLFTGLEACVEARGGLSAFAELVDIHKDLLNVWLKNKVAPTFSRLLELCYVLGVSPLQLMVAEPVTLKDTLQSRKIFRPPRPRRPAHRRIDRDRALALISDVLDGREAPLSVFELERRLGLKRGTLCRRFPQECPVITAHYRAHLSEQARQKTEQRCDEVRKVMLSLHAQGIYPSTYQVAPRLSDPNIMRKPASRETWETIIRELGFESRRREK